MTHDWREPRRVVVTGLGAVTPVGNCVAESWTNLLAGCSGIDTITLFDPTGFGVRIGGEIKNFKPEDHISSKELRHMDRSAKFALVAGKEAVADAALDMSAECPERVGVVFGTFSSVFVASALALDIWIRLDRRKGIQAE